MSRATNNVESESKQQGLNGRVEVRGIYKAYGENVVLRETNITVEAGELFTLLGPSGSGKTTLLNVVAGFTHQTDGQVLIDGERVDSLPVHRRNLGMVFQNYSLFPHMTVGENVGFPLTLRRVSKDDSRTRVTEALRMVQMDGSEAKRPSQLSGGQQQRIAIARALVFRPSVLLMDEPMSALDRKLRGQLQIELRNLHRQLGITVIFVTHDQDEALTMSDRIAVLHEGRVNQIGTPEHIYERPEGLFQAQFLGDSTTFTGTVVEIEDGHARVELSDGTVVEGRNVDARLGQESILNVRAERVRLRAADDATSKVKGTVEDSIYVGSQIRYLVSTSFTQELVVTAANVRRDAVLPVGASVSVEWNADDLACFSGGANEAS